MAEVYCDQSLGTGNDDGTTWEHAYRLLSDALDGTNTSNGDNLWLKNNATITTGDVLLAGVSNVFNNEMVKVYGVKSATTEEPPTNSDLIPGWRTGLDKTEANLAYNHSEAPTLETTAVGSDVRIKWQLYFYGVVLKCRDAMANANDTSNMRFEECELSSGIGQTGHIAFTANRLTIYFKNCSLKAGDGSSGIFNHNVGKFTFDGGKMQTGGSYIFNSTGPVITVNGSDFSAVSLPIMNLDVNTYDYGIYKFNNCQLHASSALSTGTAVNKYRMEFWGTVNVTGKSSGSIQNIDILTEAGNIVEEATAVRTGGADDGGGGPWSLAFTPFIDETRDNHWALEGIWMAFKVVAASSGNVTVYIANSGSSDYNDEEVWLELFSPSELGTAQFDSRSTQMQLLGTPSTITKDTNSTWGTGGNNPQKLTIAISPDYDGIAYCKVMFAKNFSSSPETLYVDPKPIYS